MKNLLTAFLGVLCVSLFSCQKEVEDIFKTNGNGGGNNGGNTDSLLAKLTANSGTDSTVMLFNYNSSKKLISFSVDVISAGTTASVVSERAERNAQGIIQKVIYKSEIYQQLGLDSVTSVIKSSGGRYIAEVTQFDIGGIVFADSIALFYDGGGKVIREEQYYVMLGIAELTGKTEYSYNGNNLATLKNFTWDGTDFTLNEIYTYDEHDTKVNPMYFGNDAFVFGSPEFISLNNPTKSSQSDGTTTINFTTTYTYNSSNKPVTATGVTQPGGDVQTGNYYYQ